MTSPRRQRKWQETRELKGNAILRLDEPGSCWVVESGEVAVFSVHLRDEHEDGARRYRFTAGPGEALFGATRDGMLVGIAGLNVDPYFEEPGVGRVRHLYVHPAHRRGGVGRKLTAAIERAARGHFERLQLFTPTESAANLVLFQVGITLRTGHQSQLDALPEGPDSFSAPTQAEGLVADERLLEELALFRIIY